MDKPTDDYAARVRAKYNSIGEIWTSDDRWHAYILRRVQKSIQTLAKLLDKKSLVIDVGSGGLTQAVPHSGYVHVDFAFDRLVGVPMTICADAHNLPFRDHVADCVLCVGAVASYCSLVELVLEIGRIARTGAWILFHAELTNTFELFLSQQYRADAAFVNTFYKGNEQLWMYSRKNVIRTLQAAGLEILEADYFHVASALVYKVTGRPNFAARFSWMDRFLCWIPGIGEFADSAIFLCRKRV